ncbi:dienelactone hydrolase family protein [Humisphaera borealis]|uniref:Prolyl oligopeptidase family serine peptidase n=1 Tax=Humisphaera borealis TaxID=2807512 RepID=A0A7M2WWW2_9BACT|nr:alpha/beta hydrolase [Humisphaera borealis]QOV89966.1 prolyl oligopeptidase family serine peptidase [Humisphaera borealis]
MIHRVVRGAMCCLLTLLVSGPVFSEAASRSLRPMDESLVRHFAVPPAFVGKLGTYRSPLLFDDGTSVKTPQDWQRRRQEILGYWHKTMGAWPAVIDKPRIEYLEKSQREGFTQHKVKVETAVGQMTGGYLLVPPGEGPFPAVFVPFYDAETSAGINPKAKTFRDFAYQLTRRGFVTLSIGSPGGDARKPDTAGNVLQPLSYLGYIAANGYQALASLPYVDGRRIGIVGHSYGGKWAMFGSCLYEKYAAGVWSDGGIVWDEPRSNVNYWEPWYLGLEAGKTRKPGLLNPENPRMGAYKTLVETGHDLHELHALMAPRPFLVSGGSEDQPSRWVPLNHAVAVNKLLGHENRVAMTNRPKHDPTEESNGVIYAFFEYFLGRE